jgi:hypothetical protein
MSNRRRLREEAVLLSVGTLLVLLVVWWQASEWYEAQLLAEQRAGATEEVFLRGSILSSLLNRRFARLQGLVAFVKAQPGDVRTETFATFAAELYAETTRSGPSQPATLFSVAPTNWCMEG